VSFWHHNCTSFGSYGSITIIRNNTIWCNAPETPRQKQLFVEVPAIFAYFGKVSLLKMAAFGTVATLALAPWAGLK
jgi:hypothetical protein